MSDYGPLGRGVTPILLSVDQANGEDVPAYGVLACIATSASNKLTRLYCRRPTQEDVDSPNTTYVVNGPSVIKSLGGGEAGSGAGFLLRHQPGWVLVDPEYDSGDLPVSEHFSAEIGPVADQFYMNKEGRGFRFCGLRTDDAVGGMSGTIYENRVLALEIPAGDRSQTFVVTTENCCLDAFSIEVGCEGYVEGRPCDPVTRGFLNTFSEGETPTDTVRLYPSSELRGFVAYNVVVRAIPSGDPAGYLIVSGGVDYVEAVVYADDAATLYTDTDGEVNVDFTDAFNDGTAIDQTIYLQWMLDGTSRSILKLDDFGCP